MNEETRRAFAKKIENVFNDVIYPVGHEFGTEEGELVEELTGTDWREVSLDTLVKYAGDLPFNPALFHFYLPAFLRAIVLNPSKMSDLGIIQVMLTPRQSDNEHMHRVFQWRVELFAQEQKLLIADFLEDFGELYTHMQGIPHFEPIASAIVFWRRAGQ
jgi:hypothetical protein